MPTIPTYYSKGNLPTEGMPRIPGDIGTPVGRALEQAGGQMAQQGFQFLQEEQELKFSSELVDHMTSASEQLHKLKRDTLASPEFLADPEGTAAKFAESTKQLQQEMLGKASSERMQTTLKKHFASEALHAIDQVGTSAIKRRNEIGEGKFQTGLIRIETLMGPEDSTPEQFEKNLGLGQAIIRKFALSGMKPADVAKMEQTWTGKMLTKRAHADIYNNPGKAYQELSENTGYYKYIPDKTSLLEHAQKEMERQETKGRVESERAERDRKIAQVNAIRTDLKTRFPNDFDTQLRLVDDPKIYPDLEEKEREALKSDIRQDVNFSQARAQRVQNQVDESVQATFLKDLVGGNPWTDTVITGSRASSDQQKKMMEASRAYRKHMEQNAGRVYETDKAVEADVIAGIYSGKIKDKTSLLPYLANGLSPDDVTKYAGLIDQTAKDPEHANAMHRAEQLFTDRFGKDDEMKPERARFLIDLETTAKAKGLKGKAIFDEAESQLQMIGKGWFSSGRPKFMIEREQPGLVPIPEGMSMERRRAVTDILRRSGKPTTDAYIDALDKKMQAEGK